MTSSNSTQIDASQISKRDHSELKNTEWDVVIIGGGISGAWIALHCAQQGLKTALLEKHDYASQTSSSSSKLLHGGVRYLQQMQFGKVRESAMERAEFLYAAPHLSVPVPFIVPTYKSFQKSKFFLSCGMIAYQVLCLGENKVIGSEEQTLPPVRSLSADALNSLCDLSNENHTGGVVFYERHMLDSERMVLAIIKTAQANSANCQNYLSVQNYLFSGEKVVGVEAQDELSGEAFNIKAKLVINSAGPWIDSLNAKLRNAESAPSINGFAVGSHVVTRQISDHAIAITTKHQSDAKIDRGGRHVFIIPWRGYSLIGTSYDEIDSANGEIAIQAGHVEQLLDAVNDGMPSAKLTRSDIVSGYSGLYPLRTDNIKNTVYQGTGEYQIIDHSSANGIGGLITALGAKFTTGRKLSELTMRLVNKRFGITHKVARSKLVGSDFQSLEQYKKAKVDQYAEHFSADTVQHLIALYGSELDLFVTRIINDRTLKNPICAHQHDIMGQVVWAIEKEQTLTLNDMLFNRTSLGLLGITVAELKNVALLMTQHLSWPEHELERQISEVTNRLNKTRAALDGH